MQSVARRILEVLARVGSLPGISLGDIEDMAHLHRGTAAHQRLTDLRSYGWDIRCSRPVGNDDQYRYYVLSHERARMRRYLGILSDRKVSAAKIRGKAIEVR